MRLFIVATLLSATFGLVGCNSEPTDPYAEMRMLTPEEAGVRESAQDPVLQAEKAHNAKFARKDQKKTR